MTALDTAFNYNGFTSHRTLARIAPDLLPDFDLSTKVGYFPDGHDLDPQRLREAVEQSAEDLGRIPDTVLLHNPERSPGDLAPACAALSQMRDQGLCRAWGITTWDPRPLRHATRDIPRPDVVMIRTGLTVPGAVLDAAEEFTERVNPLQRWGMAPFAGNTADPLWTTVDTALFVAPGQQATAVQAGIAAAFALPTVSRLAVGTSSPGHLAELASGARLETNAKTMTHYRVLLRRTATVGERETGERNGSAASHG
ncbi:aldo/keto reductase [Streptomyces sp. NPDC059373]